MAERVVKVRLRAEIAEYAAAMEEAANKTQAVGTESERLAQKREAFNQLGNALLGVGAGMTALTLVVAKTGIEYNTLQQTSRAALTTLLGGAKEANAQMDKLDAFARTSPFAKTTFISAQQQMLAFGIEAKKVIPYLDAIQDAVAAAGGGNQQIEEIAFIMAQISSASKITGQDLLQFGQRGINAAELIGSQMGKTGAEIKAQITAGTLGADEALDALAAGMKSKFDGAAENVKQTFSGAMDRVQAAWRDLSADLMKPLVDPNGGGTLVEFLNWTADVLRAFQALPEPIKLTGGALFAFTGFVALASGAMLKAIPKFVEMKLAFQNLTGAMRGIAIGGGIAVVALTAIAAVLGAVSAAHAEASARAKGYADTLDEATQAVTRDTREQIAGALAARESFLWLERGSAASAARDLGIAISTVTDALMGNKDAQVQVNALFAEGDAIRSKALVNQTDGERQRLTQIELLQEVYNREAEALGLSVEMARDKAEATSESADAAVVAADAYKVEADAAAKLASELKSLVDTINAANGVAQNAITANSRYQSALEGLTAQVEKNGSSLDQNSASGSANAAALVGVASAAQDAAQAQFEQDQATMSADAAANKYIGTLSAQRRSFIDAATAAGFSKDEVVKLADQIFRLPSEKDIVVLAQTAQAQREIDNFVNRNGNKTVNVWLNPQVQAMNDAFAKYMANANGGVYSGGVKKFAAGGFEPGIYPYVPGGIHKFAEEYGEAYISMDPARRDRSQAVWMRTGQELGMFSGSNAAAPQLPPIYIQSPVTGEYLLAKTAEIAGGVVRDYDGARERVSSRGVRS